MADYIWRENPACLATYKVLEDDHLMDEFEDSVTPFAKAGALKIGQLRFYPKTTGNAEMIAKLSIEKSRQFLTHITKLYTVRKELPTQKSARIIRDVAEIFGNEKATLAMLAGVVDTCLRFPGEK